MFRHSTFDIRICTIMGQKVNPKSIRLKINESWSSNWFDIQHYSTNLISDLKIRKLLMARLKNAAVSDLIISRDANKIVIDIFSGRPGVIIGRGGASSEELKKLLAPMVGGKIQINIIEVKRPDANAKIIASNIAAQMEKRMPFRRAVKQTLEKARETGASGIKIRVAGRLNGAEIARTEKFAVGTVPLSTFKSRVDYAYATALTAFGIIGIKVWVYNRDNSNVRTQNSKLRNGDTNK